MNNDNLLERARLMQLENPELTLDECFDIHRDREIDFYLEGLEDEKINNENNEDHD